MTSTSFNIGLCDNKNSSRVLKPPGGGHTDIFGIHGSNEIVTPSKRKNHPPATITGCFRQQEEKIVKEAVHDEEKNGNDIIDNGVVKNTSDENESLKNEDENNENTEPKKDNEFLADSKKVEEPAPPRRVRVPPGGFSSVLW